MFCWLTAYFLQVGVPEMSFNLWASCVFFSLYSLRRSYIIFLSKFLAKGSIHNQHDKWDDIDIHNILGYKVGRVEQAETALGAEMRMAAEKDKGKGAKAKGVAGAQDKIVRRSVATNPHSQLRNSDARTTTEN